MIRGFCIEGRIEKAYDLLLDMEEKGCAPNVLTINTLLHSFCQIGECLKVIELLHKMAKRDVEPDEITVSILEELLNKDENYHECMNLLPSFLSKSQEESKFTR